MMRPDLACLRQGRRAALLERHGQDGGVNGIDYVEVADDHRSLCVHFFGGVPDIADAEHPYGLRPEDLRIEGGRRIRGIRVLALRKQSAGDTEQDDCLRVVLDRAGDFSIYTLCVMREGFDPRYACADFSFKVDCPGTIDCKTGTPCPPAVRPAPELNYLAKDYAGFRQLMFDRLAVVMPDWKERHAPDLGVALVEVLAYTADHLSYYQDAVATEAYLDTARLRISVRRHARLVDYTLHEGLNARAWVTVWTSGDTPPVKACDVYFITGFPELKADHGRLVDERDLDGVPDSRYEAFKPLAAAPDAELRFFAAHNEIRFHTWGDSECCLPTGATRATLIDEAPQDADDGDLPPLPEDDGSATSAAAAPRRMLRLERGDVLIFEEVLGPRTGNAADADPAHRHAVRLTKVTPAVDALFGNRLVLEVEWAPQDALPFALCISARRPAPACDPIADISVARGNVVLVDHGKTVRDDESGPVPTDSSAGECACDGSAIDTTAVPAKFGLDLKRAPLTFADPLFADSSPGELPPAAQAFVRDIRRAAPQVWLTGKPAEADAAPWHWQARTHLLDSAAGDRHFVAELDDDGRAHLRFGDGALGLRPPAGMRFQARYRIGNGTAGNVGREAIAYLVLRRASWSGITVKPRNPLAAQGGAAPESTAEAKLLAPHAFRARLERAVTADDYARLAERNAAIQRAAATLRWAGSWYEARVGIDPLQANEADERLPDVIAAHLQPYRRMGHDLGVVWAHYVPLDIALRVCVLPRHARGAVKAALLDLFSNRALPDGRLGLFHPDRLTFGGGIYLSQLVAAAQAVAGVESVAVTRLQRLHQDAAGELESGVLALGATEIARLDNDPDFPEHGQLNLVLEGGS